MKAQLEIEMPDGCYDCHFCAGTECSITEGMPTIDLFGEAERKPKWCPLKPVRDAEEIRSAEARCYLGQPCRFQTPVDGGNSWKKK